MLWRSSPKWFDCAFSRLSNGVTPPKILLIVRPHLLMFQKIILSLEWCWTDLLFALLYGAATSLYLPESMGLCIVNGLVVGAVCGGHAIVGYNLELMLPGAFLWCGPILFSFPIDLTHAPNRARLLLFLVWCCQFSFCWIPPSYQSPISGRFLMLHFLFFFSLKISFP